jgi:Ca2+/Na+ antiporter
MEDRTEPFMPTWMFLVFEATTVLLAYRNYPLNDYEAILTLALMFLLLVFWGHDRVGDDDDE